MKIIWTSISYLQVKFWWNFFLPVLVMVGIFSNVGMIFPSSTDESEDFLSFPGFLMTLGSVGRLAREWNTFRLRMIAYTRCALPECYQESLNGKLPSIIVRNVTKNHGTESFSKYKRFSAILWSSPGTQHNSTTSYLRESLTVWPAKNLNNGYKMVL